MSNISHKVVVITGASSGIGESTAKLLAAQGAKLVLGARRSNRIDAVVQEIAASGGKAIGFATDVTKRAEVEALIQGAVDGFGRVDVLINNAGIMPIAPIEALKVEEWDRQIDVNIKGLHRKTRAGNPQRLAGGVEPGGNRDSTLSVATKTRQKPRDPGRGGGPIGSPAPMGWAKRQSFGLQRHTGFLALIGRGSFRNRGTHHSVERSPP